MSRRVRSSSKLPLLTAPASYDPGNEQQTRAAISDRLSTLELIADTTTTARLSVLTADATGVDAATAQAWFGDATGQDEITLAPLMTYRFHGMLILTRTAGVTSHQTSLLFGGTATLTSIHYLAFATSTAGAPISSTTATQMFASAASALTVTSPSTSATENITVMVDGVVRINAGGTFIPQFIYSAAPGGAPTILADTFFELWPVGSNTVQTVGAWA